MSELLAPAGNMESLKAAIACGADAVYLGMQQYSARAYSNNFDKEGLIEAVNYAHLRGVRVYVTMNTIVFQSELPETYKMLHFLNEAGVDAVITQDLALLTYVAQHFQNMEAHCSTQMGIDDTEGAQLAKELGASQVVISREVPLEKARKIKEQANISLEAFIHGALCISYSGNCIMSGMTGNRSGNRGRCIGSCRKLYDIVNTTTGETVGQNYILSTKDLNTIESVNQLDCFDSLKIEGRMKEPIYVANVVSRYRMALDGTATSDDIEKLNRTFNRTYTKGYLLGEDHGNITNVERPNHHGFALGTITSARKGLYEIALKIPLKQGDTIRIRHGEEDVVLTANKLYDKAGKLINGAADRCFVKLRERLSVGDAVYKTKDVAYEKELEGLLTGEYRRFPLDLQVYAFPGAPLTIDAQGLGERYTYIGGEELSEARSNPTTAEAVAKQFDRLKETVFELGRVEYEDHNAFIPAKMLNAARKDIVEHLYAQKLAAKPRGLKAAAVKQPVRFQPKTPYLTAFATTQEQYDACIEAGIETVYFDNFIPRNSACYESQNGLVLVGGMGGIHHYRATNPLVTDYSLNAVNAACVAQLHQLGAQRVTLSYEINQDQLADLLKAYQQENGGAPALEMIVYGHAPLLVTKYCPLKKMGLCGTCRTNSYEIREPHGSFPLLFGKNCDTTVLNGKVLNLLDEMPRIAGVEAFRLNFTIEDANQVKRIIAKAQGKLAGTIAEPVFDSKTDTRGYFDKEIL
ncbi:MAG: U32 family peptidase [Eggerthellales bacterium]|nr:U32 family peptidase [Eggerthellales bacterium]